MKQSLNTLPIEDFLNRARIAIKSNQKTMSLSLQEITDLQNSLSVVMTRLAGDLDKTRNSDTFDKIEVKMNGGSF